MSNNLKNLVLVGKLSISNWEAKKKAKAVERAAESAAGAASGTISARKSLLPGAEALTAVINHSAAMRGWWNDVSAPWFDNGMRVYGIAGHIQIQAEFGDHARTRDQLVGKFMAEYPELREKARFDLNDLFDENEYPHPSIVRQRFTCSLETMPLPNTQDFRLVQGIDPAELARLEAEAEARVSARLSEAMGTTVSRVAEALTTLADRLSAYTTNENAAVKGNRYYESWVANVQEMAELLPQLNIAGDPKLNDLAGDIKKAFNESPLHYRDNFAARQDATRTARDLTARLASLFTAD